VAKKLGRIENCSPPKAKGPRKTLVRPEYHGLLRRVAAHSDQRRNDGGKEGHNSPDAESL